MVARWRGRGVGGGVAAVGREALTGGRVRGRILRHTRTERPADASDDLRTPRDVRARVQSSSTGGRPAPLPDDRRRDSAFGAGGGGDLRGAARADAAAAPGHGRVRRGRYV